VALGEVVGRRVAERLAGRDATPTLPDGIRALAEREFRALETLEAADGDVSPRELWASVREVMWDHAGILRDEASLTAGLDRLAAIRARIDDLRVDGDRTGREFEFAVGLSYMLTMAEVTLVAARYRTESRGAHYREDYPNTDDGWRVNVVVSPGDTGPSLRTRTVDSPSEAVRAALDEGYELDYHLLE
jgi:succinate dehydrogenase / fumarate reductase flavoprotein subunit